MERFRDSGLASPLWSLINTIGDTIAIQLLSIVSLSKIIGEVVQRLYLAASNFSIVTVRQLRLMQYGTIPWLGFCMYVVGNFSSSFHCHLDEGGTTSFDSNFVNRIQFLHPFIISHQCYQYHQYHRLLLLIIIIIFTKRFYENSLQRTLNMICISSTW